MRRPAGQSRDLRKWFERFAKKPYSSRSYRGSCKRHGKEPIPEPGTCQSWAGGARPARVTRRGTHVFCQTTSMSLEDSSGFSVDLPEPERSVVETSAWKPRKTLETWIANVKEGSTASKNAPGEK